mgnify:CR=1 FL=1
MVGNNWWNLLLASFSSVFVFIYTVTFNNPIFSAIRSIIFFIIIFILTYLFRFFLTIMSKDIADDHHLIEDNEDDEVLQNVSSINNEPQKATSEQAKMTADAVRKMMNEN